MKYEVKTIHDDYDCETCGASYAEGYKIYRDGELVHEMKPVAHCLGGDDFKAEDWAIWIIRDLGHDVWIDGWEAAIDTNQDNNQPERTMNTDTPRSTDIRHNIHVAMVADNREQSISHLEEAHREIEAMEKELTAARAEISHMVSANGNMYLEIFIARNQRDRLAVAMRGIAEQKLAKELDDHTYEHADWEGGWDHIISIARKALADVEGGSEKQVNLIHNGVGIADMYSRDEFKNAMKRTN